LLQKTRKKSSARLADMTASIAHHSGLQDGGTVVLVYKGVLASQFWQLTLDAQMNMWAASMPCRGGSGYCPRICCCKQFDNGIFLPPYTRFVSVQELAVRAMAFRNRNYLAKQKGTKQIVVKGKENIYTSMGEREAALNLVKVGYSLSKSLQTLASLRQLLILSL
jgi:hypothetical protein